MLALGEDSGQSRTCLPRGVHGSSRSAAWRHRAPRQLTNESTLLQASHAATTLLSRLFDPLHAPRFHEHIYASPTIIYRPKLRATNNCTTSSPSLSCSYLAANRALSSVPRRERPAVKFTPLLWQQLRFCQLPCQAIPCDREARQTSFTDANSAASRT